LARAKRFLVSLYGNLDTSAHPLGANGANFGARQAFHAFGVDDVDHCSELCSESCSKSCSQCGSLYPSTSGSFFVSAEAAAFRRAGYRCTRDDRLIQRASGVKV
jgi:hypothetical protein